MVLFRAGRRGKVKVLHRELRVAQIGASQYCSQIYYVPTERLSNRAILACTRIVKIISFDNEV